LDERGRQTGVVLAGFAIALGLFVTVGRMGENSEEPPPREEPFEASARTEQERELLDAPRDAGSFDGLLEYSNCASMIGCYEPGRLERLAWEPEPASNCVGFCFNAVVEAVDEQNWRVANVVIVGKTGKRTPAVVERTRISSSSRDPAAEGKPVRYACFNRVRGKDGLRFESCSQMATLE
jgi:hypothetical protein